jgi:hypothetical protein
VSIAVDDERPPFAFVHVRATATLHPKPDDLLAWTTRVARRYAGEDAADELGRRYAEFDDLIIRVPIGGAVGHAEVVG